MMKCKYIFNTLSKVLANIPSFFWLKPYWLKALLAVLKIEIAFA